MKKISKNNLPDKPVIGYKETGECIYGDLTHRYDSIICSSGDIYMNNIVAYETIEEAKKRVHAVLKEGLE